MYKQIKFFIFIISILTLPSYGSDYQMNDTNYSATEGIFLITKNVSPEMNSSPTLSWTEINGVYPSSGSINETFLFQVKYQDIDNDPPAQGYPKLYILKGGSVICVTTMTPNGDNYISGVTYSYGTKLSSGTNYSFYFEAKDKNHNIASGTPTISRNGPDVYSVYSQLSTLKKSDKNLGIGLGYCHLSLKYDFLKKYSSEVRLASGEGINVYSLRGYYNLYSVKNIDLKCFTGIELGYITFNIPEIAGSGYESSVFIGGEYFITKKLSIIIDLAPTFIYLRNFDSSTEFIIYGIETVVNVAMCYYFNL